MQNYHFEVTENEAEQRLDKMIADQLPELSRTQIQELIKVGVVTVNGHASKPAYRLEPGDQIEAVFPDQEKSDQVLPEAIPLNVLYEDEHLAVINKPAGLVVHLGHGNESGTLVNALLARWEQVSEVGDIKRAGIVHRLDKDTSGVMIIALNSQVQRQLMTQFQQRTIEKIYWALVEGQPRTELGRIEVPISRDTVDRKKMAVSKNGREAVTTFRILQHYEKHALVELGLETGRTHQIRVHMAFIGNPVVGDPLYGFRKQTIKLHRLFLHAKTITFTHPVNGKVMKFDTELPIELQRVLESPSL